MITQKPTLSRLPLRAASVAFAALLLLGLPLAAQRGGHGGGGGGGGHTAHSTGGGGSHSPGSSGGGRSAHGVPGGGSHGFNGHGGRGFFHGGHFFYYPIGWGFWPSFSWWWGYGDPYYYDPYYYDGYYGHRYDDRSDMGALDLDVSPGRTHVFVNGEDLGKVDRYDGWPGYLWLPRGTYDIAFYLDGYKTISRQISIYPGTVIDIDDRMEKGESIRPEDLPSKSHERRDERLQYERERSEQIDRQNGDDDDQGQDWHDRIRQDRDNRGYDHRDRGGAMAGGSHLHLSVEPDDASVYLDGQFVGTGTDLSLLRRGLALSPGTHHLAVVRPGHKAVEKEFTVKEGQDVRLEIALESGSR